MTLENIKYKTYCWSLGTTSYRTKNFNQNIERQLKLLEEFWEQEENIYQNWEANKDLQIRYYDFMKEKNFLSGDASRKDKDAREKTSGLADLGLIYDNRKLTEAGKYLLEISKDNNFSSNNELQIPKDSFIYLKQLLKTYNSIDGKYVRPFIVLLFLISKLDYITMDEYANLLPLCINKSITDEMVNKIKLIRKGKLKIDEVILEIILKMDNYKQALKLFLDEEVTEELICTVGINRKSRKYDKPYYNLYLALKEVCINKNDDYIFEVYECSKAIKNKPGTLWRDYLFNTFSKSAIKKDPIATFNTNDLTRAEDENEFKKIFFKVMHLFKAKSTLSDYLDLNRRYIKISDVIIYEDNLVKFDIVPKQFFKSIIDDLYKEAFSKCNKLYSNCELKDISSCLNINEQVIINGVNIELGTNICSMEQARQVIEDERYKRLNKLIDTRFSDDVLMKLLDMFEKRDDNHITSIVTDNADIPTIFEYILGIIWYKVSGREGRILDYMKLSLESDLLPKTHAGGGEADIVYEYEETDVYPNHCLLIEATLADGTNQRRMEMEPVSRHLGNHILKTENKNSYCIFSTNYLDINVISDFRGRKNIAYFDTKDHSRSINGMKIIPLQTSDLKTIIEKKYTYKRLYKIFEGAYLSEQPIQSWYSKCIVEQLSL